MKTLPELYADKLNIHHQMKALVARAESEGRSALSDQENTEFARMDTDFKVKESEIRSIEDTNAKRKQIVDQDALLEARAKNQNITTTIPGTPGDSKSKEAEERAF